MTTDKKRIVLYNPVASFHTMPLALLAVGSAVDRDRFDVEIVDGRTEPNAHARVLALLERAVCLGMTVLSGAPIRDALDLSRRVAASHPEVPIVWGGWHPSLFSTEILKEEGSIAATVAGQGELTFREYLDRLERGESLRGIEGLSCREGGEVVAGPPRHLASLDSFAPVDYELIDVERYFTLKGRRQLDFITSIGCPFRCTFCADPFVYGRDWKALSPERVGAEIESLWLRYHFEDLNFQDETFFSYQSRVTGIAEEFLARGLEISWAATMRADQGVRLSDEALGLCVRSGLRRVMIGVESGSPEMLKRIQKDATIEQVLASAEKCVRHGIGAIFSFIVGFPGETRDQFEETLAVVKTLRRMSPQFETPIFYFKPYPGSKLSAELPGEAPTTLDGWADFDYVDGLAGRWMPKERVDRVERFKFCNRYAGGKHAAYAWPLQMASRLRQRFDWYSGMFERKLVERLRPAPELLR